MGLRQKLGMDRPTVIQMYGSVWINMDKLRFGMDQGGMECMDRPVGSGYGSGLSILTRSHIFPFNKQNSVMFVFACVRGPKSLKSHE